MSLSILVTSFFLDKLSNISHITEERAKKKTFLSPFKL